VTRKIDVCCPFPVGTPCPPFDKRRCGSHSSGSQAGQQEPTRRAIQGRGPMAGPCVPTRAYDQSAIPRGQGGR
jgi:hypothetical protein